MYTYLYSFAKRKPDLGADLFLAWSGWYVKTVRTNINFTLLMSELLAYCSKSLKERHGLF